MYFQGLEIFERGAAVWEDFTVGDSADGKTYNNSQEQSLGKKSHGHDYDPNLH